MSVCGVSISAREVLNRASEHTLDLAPSCLNYFISTLHEATQELYQLDQNDPLLNQITLITLMVSAYDHTLVGQVPTLLMFIASEVTRTLHLLSL